MMSKVRHHFFWYNVVEVVYVPYKRYQKVYSL